MAAKGSPRFNLANGSPKLRRFLATTSGFKKKKSPRSIGVNKSGGKKRADWNATQERSLVEILHEFKDYRGDNGWNTKVWNKMHTEFLERNKEISYSKAQIQEKEGQMKRDYKMLKEARRQSGSSWNHAKNMVEGPEAMWDNLIVTFPKIKKFNNNKASFPLYDALGELYDGHLAEGTYNFVSLDSPPQQEDLPLLQVEDEDAQGSHEGAVQAEDLEVLVLQDNDVQVQVAERRNDAPPQDKRAAPGSRKKEEKDAKRPRRDVIIEGMMGEFLEIKKKKLGRETTCKGKRTSSACRLLNQELHCHSQQNGSDNT